MASDAGYGFVCTFNDLVARNPAGKALITLPENAHVMPPVVIEDTSDMLLAITPGGPYVDVPGNDLPPSCRRAKAAKIINIPSAKPRVARMAWRNCYVLPPQRHADHSCWETQNSQNCVRKSYRKSRWRTWTPAVPLMRGLQRIDRVESTLLAVPAAVIAKK